MSKIICDVCGTSYPETATQCPICGCVRPNDIVTVSGDTEDAAEKTGVPYTYVKGGRFSKTNVKKRNQGKQIPSAKPSAKPAIKTTAKPSASDSPKASEANGKPGKVEVGLMVAVIVLFLAICIVAVYILLQFFAPGLFDGKQPATEPSVPTTVQTTPDDTTQPPDNLTCNEILLSKPSFTFEKAGASYELKYETYPEGSIDTATFESVDPNVATVSDDGIITAVGSGSTVIIITCGDAIAEFDVECVFETDATTPSDTTETTDPTETTAPDDETQATTPVGTKLELNREDFTFDEQGETWDLYSGDIPADQITWTSDNEKVATVKDGVVKAVGYGVTEVHATYGSEKVSCIVRCAASVGVAPETPAPDVGDSGYTLNKTDVTIVVDEKFTLELKDKDGNPVNVTWNPGNPSICSITGNIVTGKASGTTTVSGSAGGYTFKCIVRVK